jgi:antitoxin HicB
MIERLKRLPAVFYRTAAGGEPVREWLQSLPAADRKPIGSTFESWLEEEGILDETTAHAIKAVIAWQLREAMKKRRLTKKTMAERMGTSRSQLDRLLDPASDAVTLATLKRAAAVVGKRLKLDLVDAA